LKLDGARVSEIRYRMELDLEGEHAPRAYAMLTALVTPRPIAWVTTVNADGIVNAAPFSFFNALGANPPIIGFCPGNLVDESVAQAMNLTAASLPYGVSELTAAGLTAAPSSVVKPPRIAEAPASLECTKWGIIEIGGNRLIVGLVKRIHVRDELFDTTTMRVRTERYDVIGRMASPNWYCHTTSRFEMKRPD